MKLFDTDNTMKNQVWLSALLSSTLIKIPIAYAWYAGWGRRSLHSHWQRPALMAVETAFESSNGSEETTTKGFQTKNQEFTNKLTEFMSYFVPKSKIPTPNMALDSIDWSKPKRHLTSLADLALDLGDALRSSEWFVTGKVDPSFFSDDFVFEDPDIKVTGIKDYAYGTNKIFNQVTSRGEILNVIINDTVPHCITVNWRLEGNVNIGPGFKIKPYLISTDFRVSPENGLITSSLDRFSIPGYDIVLSALFPFLSGYLSEPAPLSTEIIRTRTLDLKERIKTAVSIYRESQEAYRRYGRDDHKQSLEDSKRSILQWTEQLLTYNGICRPHESWGGAKTNSSASSDSPSSRSSGINLLSTTSTTRTDSIFAQYGDTCASTLIERTECPIDGNWDLLFSNSPDSNINPSRLLGSAVITQRVISQSKEFSNMLSFPDSQFPLKRVTVYLSGSCGLARGCMSALTSALAAAGDQNGRSAPRVTSSFRSMYLLFKKVKFEFATATSGEYSENSLLSALLRILPSAGVEVTLPSLGFLRPSFETLYVDGDMRVQLTDAGYYYIFCRSSASNGRGTV